MFWAVAVHFARRRFSHFPQASIILYPSHASVLSFIWRIPRASSRFRVALSFFPHVPSPTWDLFTLCYPFLSSSPQRSLPEGLGVLLSYVDLLTMEVFMPRRQDSQNITRVLLLVEDIRFEVPNLN